MTELHKKNIKEILEYLKGSGQEEIFRFWEELNTEERNLFGDQLKSIDWDECQRALAEIFSPNGASEAFTCPTDIFSSQNNDHKTKEYRLIGEELLSKGKVAALTVAGGQGTRLGHPGPKGTFPCGPVTKKRSFGIMLRVCFIFPKISAYRHYGS